MLIVIKGAFKNRRLKTGTFKPTKSIVKEAVFNAVNFENYVSFLDLFCGSGQMGIEALSRGYERVLFIDQNIKSVIQNLKNFNLNVKSALKSDALTYLKTANEKFDLIYADPPYDFDKDSEILTLSLNLLSEGGSFFYETTAKKLDALTPLIKKLNLTVKKYGSTLLLRQKN